MKRRFWEFALISLVTILVIFVLIKNKIISVQNLKENKDVYTSIKDIITIMTVILGAVFTYYRFFIGRTFSLNAETNIDVVLIESQNNSILHCIKISIINVGNLAIWHPKAKLLISKYEAGNFKLINTIDNLREKSLTGSNKSNDSVINSGETVCFFYEKEISIDISIIKYEIEIEIANRTRWSNSKTLQNVIEKNQRNQGDYNPYKPH